MDSYPVLCTITQEAGRGGISRVSNLLWRVLQTASNSRCKLIRLVPEGRLLPNASDKLLFVKNVLRESVQGKAEWMIYDHLGLARVNDLIPRKFRPKYAVFLHSVEVWNKLSARQERILRQAKVLIANSNYTARRVADAHPGIGPIEVCHLSLLPEEDNEDVEASGDTTSQSESLITAINSNSALIVGRMVSDERHKGHDNLIEAWPKVVARVPDAQLVIVGEGDDIPRLKQKASDFNLGHSVLFTGHVTDDTLQAIYRKVGMFSMPSYGEGFGLVYLEAMRHKLACVGSVYDAAKEIIVDGVTGILVDQTDIDSLADVIVMLLGNPEKRRAMGEAGYERFQQQFTFAHFENRLLSILTKHFPIGETQAYEEVNHGVI